MIHPGSNSIIGLQGVVLNKIALYSSTVNARRRRIKPARSAQVASL